jgi:hypothetical protein
MHGRGDAIYLSPCQATCMPRYCVQSRTGLAYYLLSHKQELLGRSQCKQLSRAHQRQKTVDCRHIQSTTNELAPAMLHACGLLESTKAIHVPLRQCLHHNTHALPLLYACIHTYVLPCIHALDSINATGPAPSQRQQAQNSSASTITHFYALRMPQAFAET